MASVQDRWWTKPDPATGKKTRTSVHGVGRRWQVRYRDPVTRAQRTETFDRKPDAERRRAEVATDSSRGSWVDPRKGETPFSDWVETWSAHFEPSVRRSTWAQHESVIRNLIRPTFDGARLAFIGQPNVQNWVRQLDAQGRAPATTRKAYQVLAKIMAAAVDAEMIAKTPCRGINLPAERRDEMKFLDPHQVARLAGAIDPRYRLLVLTLAYSGLRIGEAAGLRRQDLVQGNKLRVSQTLVEVGGKVDFNEPKTKASRRAVTLPAPIATELATELMSRGGGPDALIFTSPEGGPLRLASWRRRYWVPAIRAANLEGLRIHDLRHTAVSLWIATGADPKKVSTRAGHTSVSFTLDRYGHLFDDADEQLVSRLEVAYMPAAAPVSSTPPAVSQIRTVRAGRPKQKPAPDDVAALEAELRATAYANRDEDLFDEGPQRGSGG